MDVVDIYGYTHTCAVETSASLYKYVCYICVLFICGLHIYDVSYTNMCRMVETSAYTHTSGAVVTHAPPICATAVMALLMRPITHSYAGRDSFTRAP